MKVSIMKRVVWKLSPVLGTVSAALVSATLLMGGFAQAQTVYKVVGADGKVTFSDKPPAASTNVTALGAGGKTIGGSGNALPFELRQVASKYPVTLYSSTNCGPCGSGRALLTSRGVPFSEKTVTTAEDNEALQRITGDNSLPFLTIGSQQIRGFADAEWTQYLDAAGYPKSSVLPAGYRNSAAAPLVEVQKAAPVAKTEEAQAPRTPAPVRQPPADNSSNPAGIKF